LNRFSRANLNEELESSDNCHDHRISWPSSDVKNVLIALSGPNTRIEAKFPIGATIKTILLCPTRFDLAATILVINSRREIELKFWSVGRSVHMDKDDCSNWRIYGRGARGKRVSYNSRSGRSSHVSPWERRMSILNSRYGTKGICFPLRATCAPPQLEIFARRSCESTPISWHARSSRFLFETITRGQVSSCRFMNLMSRIHIKILKNSALCNLKKNHLGVNVT